VGVSSYGTGLEVLTSTLCILQSEVSAQIKKFNAQAQIAQAKLLFGKTQAQIAQVKIKSVKAQAQEKNKISKVQAQIVQLFLKI